MRLLRLSSALILIALAACSSQREAAFHDGVDQLFNKSGMAAEYEAYVEADPRLRPETKKIRKDTSARLKALVEEERKALKD